MPATIVTSPRGEDRIARASAWLVAGGRERETLVVGATALAARTLVRRVTATFAASFGWRPTTLGGLAVRLATPRLVEGLRAAAGAAIVEGLSVRALHRLRAAGGLGRLEAIADRPGLAAAVARTLAEVRLAGLDAAALAPHAPELARLLGALEDLLEQEKLADRAALLQAAAEACAPQTAGPDAPAEKGQLSFGVDAPAEKGQLSFAMDAPAERGLSLAVGAPAQEGQPGPRGNVGRAVGGVAPVSAGQGPALLLLDVPVWTTLEARFIERLAAAAPDTLATVPAGDRRTLDRLRTHLNGAEILAGTEAGQRSPAGQGAEGQAGEGAGQGSPLLEGEGRGSPPALARLQASLFSEGMNTPAERGDDVIFLSAPGESRECVEIARRIVREAEAGVPFDRMAVLLRGPTHYRAHLEEALRRARIPVHFSNGAVQPDPAGRAFLALLACLEEGLSARRFAEYLSLGETPAPTPQNHPPPPTPAPDRWVPPDEELLPAPLAAEADVPGTFPTAAAEPEGEVPGTFPTAGRGPVGEVPGTFPTAAAEPEGEVPGTFPAAGQGLPQESLEDLPNNINQIHGSVGSGGGEVPGTFPGAAGVGGVRAPRRWEQILVDAAVIGGRGRWERRLAGWRAELILQLAEVAGDEPRAAGIQRDLAQLDALRGFALPILDDLAALPTEAPWGVWLDRLAALATRTLRWPERVLAVLAELMPMAPVGPVGLREVRVVLARRLANLTLTPSSRSAGRVFVGPVATARGLAFDVVFVPGLAERMFPQRVNQDPLLRDEVRTALGGDLPTQVDRIEAERLALRIAVGSARRKVVLSYSRVDAEQARPRVPSFYGLEVLRAVEGRLPSFEALARTADRGGATRLGWPAPEDPADAVDEAEHDLALLARLVRPDAAAVTGAARYLITSNPHLARALRHRAMRWDPSRWSYADGLVLRADEPARAALASHALSARSYSPTAMQHFAACPYRFVLHAIHKLAPREEPVAIEKINPLDRGSLVHEILYQLFTELRDRALVPVRPANLADVRQILERVLREVAERYRELLAPAIDRVWHDGLASIRADLIESLRRESEREPWSPWKLELAFGLPGTRGRDPSSTSEPVTLDCGIRLRGAIDLVETSPDGKLRATDHKTGKARQRPGSVVGGGESLQPVFYALALEKLFPERPVDGGRLHYGTSAGEFKEVLVALDRRARASATQVATALGEALDRGFLPAAPRKDECRWCDYRPVCGPWEEERTRRKHDRGDLTQLKSLRNLP